MSQGNSCWVAVPFQFKRFIMLVRNAATRPFISPKFFSMNPIRGTEAFFSSKTLFVSNSVITFVMLTNCASICPLSSDRNDVVRHKVVTLFATMSACLSTREKKSKV